MGTCLSHFNPSPNRQSLSSTQSSNTRDDNEKRFTSSSNLFSNPLSATNSKTKSRTSVNAIFHTPPPSMPPLVIPSDHPACPVPAAPQQSNGLPTHQAHRNHIEALKYEMFVERPCVAWKREETRRFGSKRKRSSSWPEAWVGYGFREKF